MYRQGIFLIVFFVIVYGDEFSSGPKTRYLYGSTHPTVSQSSIAGRLMQEGDLFIGDGYEISDDSTRIIKSPNLPFRINGLHYYWDPVFVPRDCASVSKSDSSRVGNESGPSSTSTASSTSSRSSTMSTTTDLPIIIGHPIEVLPPIPEAPIVFISSTPSTTSRTSTIPTSSLSTFASTSTKTTTKSSTTTSTVKTSPPSTRTSSSDIDDVILFLQSLHNSDNIVNTTLGDEVEISRARRQAIFISSSTTSTTTTFPPPIRPSVNISAVDPCLNIGEKSPEVCTRMLDRREARDPFMRIAFPNGTKVAELAWRCPVDMHCCDWECCEMKPLKKQGHRVLPFVITFFFLVIAVILCIFCFKYCKESEQRRRNIENFGPNDYQMTVNPPQPVESEDLDDGPREPPPVPRMHFHAHEEHRPYVPPPVPPADRVNGTYR